jgi:hypothetical protein
MQQRRRGWRTKALFPVSVRPASDTAVRTRDSEVDETGVNDMWNYPHAVAELKRRALPRRGIQELSLELMSRLNEMEMREQEDMREVIDDE